MALPTNRRSPYAVLMDDMETNASDQTPHCYPQTDSLPCSDASQSLPDPLPHRSKPPMSIQCPSNSGIVIDEPNIPDSPSPAPHSHTATEVLISLGPLVPLVTCQHALDAHADALDGLDGGPALGPEQVETDDPIRVDVWVDWDRARGGLRVWRGRLVGCRCCRLVAGVGGGGCG